MNCAILFACPKMETSGVVPAERVKMRSEMGTCAGKEGKYKIVIYA